jgi:glycosyltransferase involved in cell wall biosynthesis
MKIALLIPCYNEEITIEKVIQDFRNQISELEIYVYDNNSSDRTSEIAKNAGAFVAMEFRQGKANVVRSMFERIDADVYIMVDGDDTYPAKHVKELLAPVLYNGYDMVIGDRLTNGTYSSENKRNFHEFGNNLVKYLINKLFKANLKDIMSGYRVFSRKFVKNYPVLYSGFELETDMTIFSLHNNFLIKEIPIDFQDRPEGSESKLNTFSDGFKVLLTIFNLFRHYKPLLFFGIISLISLLIALGFGIPVIREYYLYQFVYKVPSAVLASGLVLVSILTFAIGLILDTISKIDRINFEIRIKTLNGNK